MEKESILELERRFAELLKGPKRSKASTSKIDSKKKITAAELQAQLQKDEEYQKWLKEKEIVRQALENALRVETKEMLNDFEVAGLKVYSVYDLVNTSKSYKEAIPILIRHLSKDYHYKNKEGIVRALSVKEAIGKAAPALIEEYNRAPKELTSYRWAIGNSVFTTITSNDVEEVLKIVKDKSNGESRHMFILALSKVRSKEIDQILTDLLDDKEVAKYATEALGKIKFKK